jgi:hypothetical protein
MAKKQISSYAQKLKDPRWQKLRLEALESAGWRCKQCHDESSPLNVHHGFYQYGLEPWDYPIKSLHVYCESCHQEADFLREELRFLVGHMSLAAQTELRDMLHNLSYTVSPAQDKIAVLKQAADLARAFSGKWGYISPQDAGIAYPTR